VPVIFRDGRGARRALPREAYFRTKGRPKMNSRLFSEFATLALVAACSGSVVPIAENGGDSGTGGQGQDAANGNGGDGSASGGADAGATEGGNKPFDGGSSDCGDSGGNSCFCGELVCVDGQWTCTSCQIDGGPGGCSPACQAAEVCVRDLTQGGAIILASDAGTCPSGRHPENGICQRDPTYYCAPLPSACSGAPLTCDCAGTLCTTQQSCMYQCRGTTANEVDCECDVP
jgi:hypothetical protein